MSEQQLTLWRTLPALEELQTTWEHKQDLECFALYKDAINAGLSKLHKYHSWIDTKPVIILMLGMFFVSPLASILCLSLLIIVLHPYYKLDYIKLSWGGAEKQVMKCLEGNPWAKKWQDEVLKVVEKTVSVNFQSGLPSYINDE